MATRARRGRRWLAVVVIALGAWVLLSGLVQPVKAHVGQTLLDRTFNDRLAAPADQQVDAENWRPWPWAELAPVGELYFPAHDEERVIVDSASGEALAWGAGHMVGTAGLGDPGISVVAGHRDGVFGLLNDVHEGDIVELTTLDGRRVEYVVQQRRIVDARYEDVPISHSGPDQLLLTTCWPIEALRSGPDRLVIEARALTTA